MMTRIIYPAIFHNAQEGGYWIEFPDLLGCVTQGDTLQDSMEYAGEALGTYLASLIEGDVAFPPATAIDEIQPEDGFANYISIDIEKYTNKNKTVAKNLTIPQWLNDAAEKQNINFSSVLKEALLKKIV